MTKNTNDSLQGTFGKYYPRVEYKGTIGTLELAKHMSAHTTSFSKGEINGMLTDLVDCIRELCLMGYVVKIEDLGLFKCSVEGNGLTLKQGARVSAGMGVQRTDEELAADITKQQSAYSAVKIIMQATGETTIEKMNRDAKTSFTSKTKQLIKSLSQHLTDLDAQIDRRIIIALLDRADRLPGYSDRISEVCLRHIHARPGSF